MEFINLSTTKTVLLMISIIVLFIIIGFIYKKYGRGRALWFSLPFGILLGIIFYLLTDNLSQDSQAYHEITFWLELPTYVFLTLVVLVIPLYIISTMIITLNKERHHKYSKSYLISSFLSLWSMSLIGILIAIALTPLIKFIDLPSSGSFLESDASSTQSIPEIFTNLWPINLNVFLNANSILGVVVVSIFVSLIIRFMHTKIKYHSITERIISFFVKLNHICSQYLSYVIILIPFVIITKMATLFDGTQDILTNFSSISIFISIFFLGLFIIYAIELAIVYKLAPNRKGIKKIIRPLAINSLIKHSAPLLLPDTIQAIKSVGIDEETASITPSIGTSMGFSMCGGFYPAMIAIMSANLDPNSELGISFYIILLIIIMFTSLGMTGVPGADVAVILSVVGSTGSSIGYFATVYIFDGIFDSFRTIGNSMGFVAASLIAHTYVEKKQQKHLEKETSLKTL